MVNIPQKAPVPKSVVDIVHLRSVNGSTLPSWVTLTADGEEVEYHITDYYNEDCNEIVDTRIWKLSDKILDDLQVKIDSRLGIKILGFITSEHFYRNDVLESMYVKDMEDKIDSYYEK